MKTFAVPFALLTALSAPVSRAGEVFDAPGRGYREQSGQIVPKEFSKEHPTIWTKPQWSASELREREIFRMEVTPKSEFEAGFGLVFPSASKYEEALSKPIEIFGTRVWPGADRFFGPQVIQGTGTLKGVPKTPKK